MPVVPGYCTNVTRSIGIFFSARAIETIVGMLERPLDSVMFRSAALVRLYSVLDAYRDGIGLPPIPPCPGAGIAAHDEDAEATLDRADLGWRTISLTDELHDGLLVHRVQRDRTDRSDAHQNHG